jgi:lysophospholipase L1-like esterase
MKLRTLYFLLLAQALVPIALANVDAASSELRWRLENPFRLFREPADFERLRMLPGESIRDWYRRHAHALTTEGYLPSRRTWWDPQGGVNDDGQYQPTYLHPSSHRVVLSLGGEAADARCTWSLNSSFPALPEEAVPSSSIRREIVAPCRGVTVEVPYRPDAGGVGKPVLVKVVAPDGREASTNIQVRDLLVLGLGDSFSSGEGVPDTPARLSRDDARVNRLSSLGGEFTRIPVPQVVTGKKPVWWDNECHRSLLSWQALAALRLASEASHALSGRPDLPQTAVTFASYACSGAEVWDGMLQAQASPPGDTKVQKEKRTVQRSQVHAASRDLCDRLGVEGTAGSHPRIYSVYRCAGGVRRTPDLVLMSIGGNDAGFARVIMHTLLPGPGLGNSWPGSAALAGLKSVLRTVDNEEAVRRTKTLESKLPLLSGVMQEYLSVQPDRVFFMQYPDSLSRPKELRQPGKENSCGLEMRAGSEAARFMTSGFDDHWHMWGTQKEFRAIRDDVVTLLHKTIKSSKGDWNLIDTHLADFLDHGLCADAVLVEEDGLKDAKDALLPNVRAYGLASVHPDENKRARPSPPYFFDGAYNPSTKRWFRTPNDSVQVQTEAHLQQSMNGAFHPNGGGHARMADAAFDAIKGAGGSKAQAAP